MIADQCQVAEDFFDRLRGLIGRVAMEPGEGMFFSKCNDIHLWWMTISIDVVFLRREICDGIVIYRVLSLHSWVRPWRFLPLWNRKATDTLELTAGTVERWGLSVGDELCIS